METLSRWIQVATSLNPVIQGKLLTSLVIIFVLWALQWGVYRLVVWRSQESRTHYRWRKSLHYLAIGIGIFLVGRVWLEGLASLATFLGLVSAGIAIALGDLVTGLAGWMFILTRRPFELGDRIEIGGYRGDVIDLRPFAFSLIEIGNWVDADQSTGRIIHIPNGRVLREPMANYTQGFNYIWHEIPVMVTFESNWEEAKRIISEVVIEYSEQLSDSAARRVRMAARRYYIVFSKLTPIVYTTVADSGIVLTMRFLCQPRRRRGTSEAIWEAICASLPKGMISTWPTPPSASTTTGWRANRARVANLVRGKGDRKHLAHHTPLLPHLYCLTLETL